MTINAKLWGGPRDGDVVATQDFSDLIIPGLLNPDEILGTHEGRPQKILRGRYQPNLDTVENDAFGMPYVCRYDWKGWI